MNRKFEDNLLRLAFEDMSPQEAAALEREALQDPEAALALAQYRQMRTGLRDLAEVPSDQLSKERLREAILARGLTHEAKPAARSFGWSWMPVMAAGLAVLVFVYRPHAGTDPKIASHREANPFTYPTIEVPPSGPVAMNSSKMIETAGVGTSSASFMSPSVPAQTVAIVTHPNRNGLRSRHQARNERSLNGLFAFSGTGTGNVMESVIKPAPSTSGADTATMASPAAATPPASPIVLIGNEKDGSTGASRATEVDSARNVVVGG